MTIITEQLGRVLAGRYRLDAGLGTGTSAHVYEAFDTRLGRRVAVKLLHPGLDRDERFLRRLRTEAQAAAALNHPNVLKVFDWGEDEDGPYLILELLTGGSLQDLLDAGVRLDPAQAANVGAQAARGLAYAHRRGFVHRDIKPANLLFDEDGALRVADFGLARALAEAAWTEPAGAVLGTARYASPEQAEGRSLDDRSDVYSLALTLYEAVVGRVPFSADTTLATLMARIGAPLPMAHELGPLAPILAQAAISEPLARLDATELADNLDLLARQLPAPAPLPLVGRRQASRDGAPNRAERTSSVPGIYDGESRDWEISNRESSSRESFGRESFGPTDDRRRGTARGAAAADAGLADGDRATVVRARRRAPRRRRRVALGVLSALLVLAGGAAAAVRFVLLGHVIPRLDGVALQLARREVSRAGLRIDVTGGRFSAAAPAGAVVTQSPRAGSLERSGAVVRVVVSEGRAPVSVPSVAGRGGATAVTLLKSAHLVPRVSTVYSETVGAGRVVSSSPASGRAPYGGTVMVVISRGPAPRTIPSSLVGVAWSSADSALQGLRLVPSERLAYSSTVTAGDVISTSPAGGVSGVRVGSTVDVIVSRGPRLVAVPRVNGLAIDAAIAKLQQAGLAVTEQVGPPHATYATATDPLAGASVVPGTDVTLYVA